MRRNTQDALRRALWLCAAARCRRECAIRRQSQRGTCASVRRPSSTARHKRIRTETIRTETIRTGCYTCAPGCSTCAPGCNACVPVATHVPPVATPAPPVATPAPPVATRVPPVATERHGGVLLACLPERQPIDGAQQRAERGELVRLRSVRSVRQHSNAINRRKGRSPLRSVGWRAGVCISACIFAWPRPRRSPARGVCAWLRVLAYIPVQARVCGRVRWWACVRAGERASACVCACVCVACAHFA